MVVVLMFDAVQQLYGEHGDGLERELAITLIIKRFETLSQQFHHHDVVVAGSSAPVNGWKSGTRLDGAIHLELFHQLRVLRVLRLNLDRALLLCPQINAEIDLTERSTADLHLRLIELTDGAVVQHGGGGAGGQRQMATSRAHSRAYVMQQSQQ